MPNVQGAYISENSLYRNKCILLVFICNFIILNIKLYRNKMILYIKIFHKLLMILILPYLLF